MPGQINPRGRTILTKILDIHCWSDAGSCSGIFLVCFVDLFLWGFFVCLFDMLFFLLLLLFACVLVGGFLLLLVGCFVVLFVWGPFKSVGWVAGLLLLFVSLVSWGGGGGGCGGVILHLFPYFSTDAKSGPSVRAWM